MLQAAFSAMNDAELGSRRRSYAAKLSPDNKVGHRNSRGYSMNQIDEILNRQRAKEGEERRTLIEALLACSVVEIEIVPFNDAKDRAAFFIQGAAAAHKYSLEISECFSVLEHFLAHGFAVLSCGKHELGSDERWQGISGCMNSWFILARANAQPGSQPGAAQ